MYDLISLGEPLLRLAPARFGRLRRATSLDVRLAGAQLNVAANLAQLGKRTAFISQVPDNELGLLVRDSCLSYGVDVSHLRLVPGTRLGTVYVEFGTTPRVGVSVFDRQHSAASLIGPESFAWDEILKDARLAHTDGIFAGLSAQCYQATLEFLASAKRQGCTTTFDVNYREHLWTAEQARRALFAILPHVDILATNRTVSEQVLGLRGTDEEILAAYRGEFGCRVVCLTSREIPSVLHGAWCSMALSDAGVARGRRYEFDVVDRFGTGDAWFAGFLYGYLAQGIEFGLSFGNALCALAHTTEGDVIQNSVEDVMPLLDGDYDLRIRR